MKSKKVYCVWYEIVNLETRKTEKRILVKNVSFKTAHTVKKNHKGIVSIHVSQWLPTEADTKVGE